MAGSRLRGDPRRYRPKRIGRRERARARVRWGLTSQEWEESDPDDIRALEEADREQAEEWDVRFARLALHFCSALGAKKREGGPLQVTDFLPAKPVSAEDRELLLRAKLATATAGIAKARRKRQTARAPTDTTAQTP